MQSITLNNNYIVRVGASLHPLPSRQSVTVLPRQHRVHTRQATGRPGCCCCCCCCRRRAVPEPLSQELARCRRLTRRPPLDGNNDRHALAPAAAAAAAATAKRPDESLSRELSWYFFVRWCRLRLTFFYCKTNPTLIPSVCQQKNMGALRNGSAANTAATDAGR